MLREAHRSLVGANKALLRELNETRSRYERDAAMWKSNFDELKRLLQEERARSRDMESQHQREKTLWEGWRKSDQHGLIIGGQQDQQDQQEDREREREQERKQDEREGQVHPKDYEDYQHHQQHQPQQQRSAWTAESSILSADLKNLLADVQQSGGWEGLGKSTSSASAASAGGVSAGLETLNKQMRVSSEKQTPASSMHDELDDESFLLKQLLSVEGLGSR